jgi:predicted negative regulator of RcsB-dependent stress response
LHGVDQSNKAASLYDELEQAAQASNLEKINQAFENLKLHYPKTIWAQQAALVAAKNQAEKGQVEAGLSSLRWVSAQATEPMYAWIARLRMTGLLIDSQQWDAALRELEGAAPPSLEGLIADRRGDILNLQGHREEAISAYQKAWKILDATSEYRQLVEAKLLALGSDTGVSK